MGWKIGLWNMDELIWFGLSLQKEALIPILHKSSGYTGPLLAAVAVRHDVLGSRLSTITRAAVVSGDWGYFKWSHETPTVATFMSGEVVEIFMPYYVRTAADLKIEKNFDEIITIGSCLHLC